MVSSSSSSSSSWESHVFLSFTRCGEEAVQSFAGHLCEALHQKGVLTFMSAGGEREEGDLLWLEAIEGCSTCIPILGASYTESRKCLTELSKMVDRQKMILPVFFDVDPSDVRHQRGSFQVATGQHHLPNGFEENLVGQWRKALGDVADIAGYVISNLTDGDENKWIQLIVKRVLNVLNNARVDVGEHLVGMESRVTDIMELLRPDANDVKLIGIHGMGGIGKTTLAKVVYNKIYKKYDASCFIPNISETSKQYKGLVSLQEKLVSKILQKKNMEINDVSRGIAIIKERFHIKKVLIVLDDLDHKEQLEALAGSRHWFHPGSRIIITTRYEHVLNVCKVSTYEIYRPIELNSVESLELFSYHAFGKGQPIEEFMELSEKVISTTGGLPMALEVIGSFLFDKKHVAEWQHFLDKTKHIPFNDVQQRLKISYDGLDEEEKKIFLDIACFFVTMDKDYLIDIWQCCGFGSRLAIKVLLHKSLIKIGRRNKVEMHDLLRDMGKRIVQENYPDKPSLHSRLWDRDKVLEILDNDKGTSNLEGIGVNFYGGAVRRDLCTESFLKMPSLRLLRANYATFEGKFEHIPTEVRWLQWRGCSLESLPDDFNLRNLGVLDLRGSMITQIWDKSWHSLNKIFNQLKVLDLRSCIHLEAMPDFSSLPALEKLNFRNCVKLVTVHESICNLNRLCVLDMTSCKMIKEIPRNFSQLSSLEVFRLSRCNQFHDLPEQLDALGSLRELLVEHAGIRTIPCSMGFLKGLRQLSFRGCRHLESLPDSIGNMTKLEMLRLDGCSSLRTLPDSFGNMKNLTEVDLSNTSIEEFPHCMESFQKLKKLLVQGCKELRSLPDQLGSLTGLEELDFRECVSLEKLPESIGNMKSLFKLRLSECGIEKLPDSSGGLVGLRKMPLSKCNNLRILPSAIGSLTKIVELDLSKCKSVRQLPDSIGKMIYLSELDLSETGIEELPDSIGFLKELKKLSLNMCSELQHLPYSIGNLTKLENLDLHHCESLNSLPDSFGMMKNLVKLDLSETGIEELPESVGSLEKLIELRLSECSELKSLPNQFGGLSSLEKLDLWYCSSLRTLPDSIGELKNLALLFLEHTGIEELPNSIVLLDKLQELPLSVCRRLRCLPDQIGNMTKLEKLILWCCESLQLLPESIGNLKNLLELDLSKSGIEALPDSIGSLKKLKVLQSSRCKLKTLPGEIGNMNNLEDLHLRRCELLTTLPDSIGLLANLVMLDISETGIEELPHSIILLKKLITLKIMGCMKLKGLPLGRMNCLQHLFVMGRGEEEYKDDDYYQVSKTMLRMSGLCQHLQEYRRIEFINSELDIDIRRLRWKLLIRMEDTEWVVQVVDEHKEEWGLHMGMQWLSIIFPSRFVCDMMGD